MRGFTRGLAVAVVVGMVGGAPACLEPTATPCADGSLCSASEACAPAGGCVDRDLLEACEGIADGEGCDAVGLGAGVCAAGVCVLRACGNDVLDDGEACDDGNQASGDGCRADCLKVEVCGDALVDAGEACDDGNRNDADACTATCAATAWTATSLLAGAPLAVEVGLNNPIAVAVDRLGNVFVGEGQTYLVRRIDAQTGEATVFAGTGVYGQHGDGGPARAAELGNPIGLAVDGVGNVFIADAGQPLVRKVAQATGIITTIAGTGATGDSGDGGPATAAQFRELGALAVDGLGRVYLTDVGAHRVRRIELDGTITAVAGTGSAGLSGDGGPASAAALARPRAVAIGPADEVAIADADNARIRIIEDGIIRSLTGSGALQTPVGVAFDPAGQLLVLDYQAARIWRIDPATDAATLVAGDGNIDFGGDGGPAIAGRFAYPRGLACGADGTIYVADTVNHRVRQVDVAGQLATIAGSGAIGETGDGGAATAALMYRPEAVVLDADGAMYIAETGLHRIRRVDAAGIITTLAGTGDSGFAGDGGPASAAELSSPRGLALDDAGGLLIADAGNARIRRVDLATGVITTVVGTGEVGGTGDGGPASAARLRRPMGIEVCDGALYIADRDDHRVRVVTGGTIAAFAGTGASGSAGDGGSALAATMIAPVDVACGAAGEVYVVDRTDDRVRQVLAGTITSVVDGTTLAGGLDRPGSVATSSAGDLYVADAGHYQIVRRSAAGDVTVVAGRGFSESRGDGGPASAAAFQEPLGVAVGADDELRIVDWYPGFVRHVRADGIIVTVAGKVDPAGTGPRAQARLATPTALDVAAPFTLLAGGVSGVVQALRGATGPLETVIGQYPLYVATGDLARFRRANFGPVRGVAYDAVGDRIFLSDDNVMYVVTWTDRDDVLTWTIAAISENFGTSGHRDGPLASARFRAPSGLLLDEATQVLYVADTGNHVIRAIDLATSTVSTVVGTPAVRGYFGDGLAATAALLDGPTAMTLGPAGELYIADTGNHRVRRVDPGSGVITTVLGDGVAASSGDGAPATSFPVDAPAGLGCDPGGNLYVSSTNTVRQLVADDAGVVDGSGAVRTIFGAPPRDVFPATATACLSGVTVLDATTVWAVDACAGLLVELRRTTTP